MTAKDTQSQGATLLQSGVTAETMSAWTLPAQLRLRAAEMGDEPFLKFEGGHMATYRETLKQSEAIAAGLENYGVRKGDRVALLMDNCAEFIYSWFATNLLGAIEVPINPANRGITLEHPFNNCEARVAIVAESLFPHLVAVVEKLQFLETVIIVEDDTASNKEPDVTSDIDLPWQTYSFAKLSQSGNAPSAVDVAFHEPCAIMYTSGTSGPAKGVQMSHAHMYMLGRQVVEHLAITNRDIYMVCLPLFHANAQAMQVYAALQVGASTMIYSRFSATKWLDQLRECHATVSGLLGVMAQFLYAQPSTEHDAENPLERLLCLPLPGPIAEDFQNRFGVTCLEAYGSTEAGLPIFSPPEKPVRPGSCGKVLELWYEVLLVDPETDLPVSEGEIGEILVRPRVPFTMFDCYYKMPEATVRAWRNLWFHTGDLAFRDEDNYYFFVDRTSDRIRRRGENIASHDIEAVLSSHQHIEECAAIGVPAEEGEDEIKVYVVLSGEAAINCPDLIAHCDRQLPYFAVPRYIEVIPQLPKTPSGKVQKKELRSLGVTGVEWDRCAPAQTVNEQS